MLHSQWKNAERALDVPQSIKDFSKVESWERGGLHKVTLTEKMP